MKQDCMADIDNMTNVIYILGIILVFLSLKLVTMTLTKKKNISYSIWDENPEPPLKKFGRRNKSSIPQTAPVF